MTLTNSTTIYSFYISTYTQICTNVLISRRILYCKKVGDGDFVLKKVVPTGQPLSGKVMTFVTMKTCIWYKVDRDQVM